MNPIYIFIVIFIIIMAMFSILYNHNKENKNTINPEDNSIKINELLNSLPDYEGKLDDISTVVNLYIAENDIGSNHHNKENTMREFISRFKQRIKKSFVDVRYNEGVVKVYIKGDKLIWESKTTDGLKTIIDNRLGLTDMQIAGEIMRELTPSYVFKEMKKAKFRRIILINKIKNLINNKK